MYVYFSVKSYELAAFIVCFLLLTFGCLRWMHRKKRLRPPPVATSESDRRHRQEGLRCDCFASLSLDDAADDKSERACPGRSAEAAEDNIDSEHSDKSLHTVLTEVGSCIVLTGTSVKLENKVLIHRNAMTDFNDAEDNEDLRVAASNWSDDTGTTLKRQDADFDDKEETNANKLEFDDSYRAQCLQSNDNRQKKKSSLTKDTDAIFEYLTNFSLLFTQPHLPADNRETEVMTPRGPGDSKDGEDQLLPDESFSQAQGIKVFLQPECTPDHLTWCSPLPRKEWSLRCSMSTWKLPQLQEELHLPFSAKPKLEEGAENVSITSATSLTLNPSSKKQQSYDENAGISQAADSRVTDRDSGLSSIIFRSPTDADTGQGYSSAGSCPLPEVEVVRNKTWTVETSHEEPPMAFFTRAHATKPCVFQSTDVSKPSGCCEDPASQVSVTPGQRAKSESVSPLPARGGCRSPRSAATAKTKSRSLLVTGTKVQPRLTVLHLKSKVSLSEGCLVDNPLCTSSVKDLVELVANSSTADFKRCAGVASRRRAQSTVNDSLLWDSYLLRSASESLIWENAI